MKIKLKRADLILISIQNSSNHLMERQTRRPNADSHHIGQLAACPKRFLCRL